MTKLATCPGCRQGLRVPGAWAGRTVRCRFCGEILQARRVNGPAANGHAARLPDDDIPEADAVGSAAGLPAGHRPAYRRPGQRGNKLVLGLVFVCLALAGLVGVLVLKPSLLGLGGGEPEPVAEKPEGGNPADAAGQFVGGGRVFPRRLLAVNVSNYLFANPLHTGRPESAEGVDENTYWDVHEVVDRLAKSWRVPESQVYELSDTLPRGEAVAPLKGVILETVKRFCETSRRQDHVVVMFTGHAAEIDGRAYLVPIDGDLEEPKSLVPLTEVYALLKSCPAQEKLFILDVARKNPGRGREWPGGGPMSKELEKAIHTPPPGVKVWTSCSAGQSSYEFEYALDRQTNYQSWGGVFLSQFLYASKLPKVFDVGGQRPQDPLPFGELRAAVSRRLPEVTKNLTNDVAQVPKLSGDTLSKIVDYDPEEPLPARFELPRPPAGADPEVIKALVERIRVPPIKIQRSGRELPLHEIYPFPPDALAGLDADGVTEGQILGGPNRYPVREVTLRARDILRELREPAEGGDTSDQALPEEIRGETSDALKARVRVIQYLLATHTRITRDLLEEMDRIAEGYLDLEKSKRWLTHFKFMHAQVKARYAYLNEYNLMLGKVLKDELPGLKGGQSGWRLASQEKLQSSRDVRDIQRDAWDLLEELIEDHPKTPWAVLAKRQRYAALGLYWEGASFAR